MSSAKSIFCVFPHIQLTKPTHIRNRLVFPTSYIEALDIPETDLSHFDSIKKLFYNFKNEQLKTVTWMYISSDDEVEISSFRTCVDEVRLLIGYLCCVPDNRPAFPHLYATYEYADYYLFEPSELAVDSKYVYQIRFEQKKSRSKRDSNERYLAGYRYSRNSHSQGEIIHGARIYPRVRILDSIHLDTSAYKVEPDYLTYFGHGYERNRYRVFELFDPGNVNQEDKLFQAIKWYNKSCYAELDDDTVLVNLAIAFEALLGEHGQKDGKTNTLLHFITLLTGNDKRTEIWINKFYNARSDIVHEGTTNQIRFRHNENSEEYGRNSDYGRLIFRVCLNAIIEGLYRAKSLNIKALFVTNSERLDKICKALNPKSTTTPKEAIKSVMDDIHYLMQYPYEDFIPIELKAVNAASKLLINRLLQTNNELDTDEREKLLAVVNSPIPVNAEFSDVITEHIIHVLKSAPNDTSQDAKQVINGLVLDLENKSISDMKKISQKIEHDLMDNLKLDALLQHRLEQIVILTQWAFFISKLQPLVELAKDRNWVAPYENKLYSVINVYAQFVKHIVSDKDFRIRSYLHCYKHRWMYNE